MKRLKKKINLVIITKSDQVGTQQLKAGLGLIPKNIKNTKQNGSNPVFVSGWSILEHDRRL